MINLFPTMFLALVAHALLRLFVGLALVYLGVRHYGRDRAMLVQTISTNFPSFSKMARFMAFKLAVIEVIIGCMFVAGFYTQIAALAAIILSLKMLVFRKSFSYPLVPQSLFWFLVIGVSISLFITGAGILAFDIPI